jgi:cytochrome c556
MAVKVTIERKEIRALLRSPEVKRDLERRAKRIADAAGEGFEADSETGTNRARATVWTDTFEAMRAEATDRALTRSIDAGRR